jgi:hypothetical protein
LTNRRPAPVQRDVQALVEAKGWDRVGLPGVEPDDSVGAVIGSYHESPVRVVVVAFWIFDEQERLIDIHIYKLKDTRREATGPAAVREPVGRLPERRWLSARHFIFQGRGVVTGPCPEAF